MQCPFLAGNYMNYCNIEKQVYVPSTFELNEYCKASMHRMCPFYCKVRADGRIVIPDERLSAGSQA